MILIFNAFGMAEQDAPMVMTLLGEDQELGSFIPGSFQNRLSVA